MMVLREYGSFFVMFLNTHILFIPYILSEKYNPYL